MTQRHITFKIERTYEVNNTRNENCSYLSAKDFMPFAMAFETMRRLPNQYVMSRDGWNGTGMHVAMAKLAIVDGIVIDNDCLILKNVKGAFNTWVPSGTDLMAEDWYLIEIIDTAISDDFSTGGEANVGIA